MEESLKKQLAIAATRIRMSVINGTYHAKSGHPGGSLSVADLMAYLYFAEMRVDPQNPRWQGRDRLVLSKGHTAPALYGALALKGFFPVEEIDSLRHTGAMLQGHPDMKGTPGVDMSTGSLGQGLSAAVGMALAGRLDGRDYRVYALLGDGELAEGQVWEAAMSAAKYKLDNLCAFVDLNGLQIDGKTADVMPTAPVDKKFEAFNWNVLTVDGHDCAAVADALEQAKAAQGRPTVILARTVKGKGVSFMENNAGWHGKAPNDEQYEQAIAELRAALAQLEVN